MRCRSVRSLRVEANVVLALVLFGVGAGATTEPPAAYDARSVAMGGSGVAHVHNGAAIYHNPAALEGMEQGAFTAVFAPSKVTNTVPLNGPGTSVSSDASLFPMFFVGGGYRVHEDLVVGAAVYPSAGLGSVYEDVQTPAGPVDLNQMVMALDVVPAVSYAVSDAVAFGVGYRVSYLEQQAEQLAPMPGPPGQPPSMAKAELDMSGWNFAGIHAGAFFRLGPSTRLGLTYRNKVTADLEGTLRAGGAESPASASFTTPHRFKVGVAQGALDDRLLVAADVRYSLYAESGKELVTHVATPAGDQEMVVTLNWQNVWIVNAGAEYRVVPSFAVRAGYTVGNTATTEARANYYMPPPAILQALHAGVGVTLGSLDLDAGAFYAFGGKDAEPKQDSPAASNPGRYETEFMSLALAATYRL